MSSPGGADASLGLTRPPGSSSGRAVVAPTTSTDSAAGTTEPAARRATQPDDRETLVLGPGTRFEGILTFDGFARIAGEIRGQIICTGTLQLEAGGLVEGSIEGDALLIAGEVRGEAIARDRIELAATARVRGGIRAPRLALAEGCVLDGPCSVGPSSEVSVGTDPAVVPDPRSAVPSEDPDSA